MRNPARQQENFTFFNIDGPRLVVFNDLDLNIAFQLVEKLFAFVVMVIFARIWPANYHYYKIFIVFVNLLVAYWRFKQMTVFIDPFFKIERCCYGHSFLVKNGRVIGLKSKT